MHEIVGLVFSWQFLSFGVLTSLIMTLFFSVGSILWEVRLLRGILRFFDAMKPWIPWIIGGGLGAIPFWPRPNVIMELSDTYGYFSMIFLGVVAGAFYERIWKSVKQVIEARGINLDIDLPPKDQKKWK